MIGVQRSYSRLQLWQGYYPLTHPYHTGILRLKQPIWTLPGDSSVVTDDRDVNPKVPDGK